MAHELGHLVRGHHDQGLSDAERDRHEAVANAFAADLLLPREALATIGWNLPDVVREWAGQATQRLLRHHWAADSGKDEITLRMDTAARRRFPLAIQEAHLIGIASGVLGKGTLAWMLGIHPDALEVDTPTVPEADVDDLVKALGL